VGACRAIGAERVPTGFEPEVDGASPWNATLAGCVCHRADPASPERKPDCTMRYDVCSCIFEMLVSDFLVESLIAEGVRHVFGVGGANIEDLFSAVQRQRPRIRAVLCKHEHGAGSAADAYSRISGFGAVMVTSGGGAMNLVHALAEARASRSPLLAIVGEAPSDLQGRGAFQDTSGAGDTVDALAVYRAVATWAARVRDPASIPALLDEAIGRAKGRRPGPVVLLVAKDHQSAEISTSSHVVRAAEMAAVEPLALERAQAVLASRPVVVIAGDAVAREGVVSDLKRLVYVLDARVAVTPDARDAFDNGDPRFVGVAGAMGHARVAEAVAEAAVVLMVGTRLPLLARQGLEVILAAKSVVAIGPDAPFVSQPKVRLLDVPSALRALAKDTPAPPGATESLSPLSRGSARFDVRGVLERLSDGLPDDGIVLTDAGNTGASAIHWVRAPRDGRWLVAMGMAGMGYAYGAAIGAALASGRRCTAISGDGAFFMHGLEIHTAVEYGLPITFVVLNNRAHGMCLVRERLFLHENAGYNSFASSHLGAGLGRMFPQLLASDCESLDEVADALRRARFHRGPSLIVAELDDVEIPPFAAFRKARDAGIEKVERNDAKD
jgi:acetolactate synthase I/II/III large subunit